MSTKRQEYDQPLAALMVDLLKQALSQPDGLKAARVLTEPGHAGATYELAAAELLSQAQVAEILGRHLGRPVRAQAVPLARWEGQARASGLGGTQIQSLLQMFRYYERYGFRGNANVLEWLLGRPTTTFVAFVARAFPLQESGSV